MKDPISGPESGAASAGNCADTAFVDFDGVLKIVPFGSRTLRRLIKQGVVPCIRPPGTRKLIFSPGSVRQALMRFERKGIQ